MTEELLRRSIDAWNEDDWEALESMWEPDGEIVPPAGWPEGNPAQGWPAMRRQFERIKGSWNMERAELLDVSEVPAGLLAAIRWISRGEASGVPLEVDMWMLCGVRGGRFQRIQYFLDRGAAQIAAEESP